MDAGPQPVRWTGSRRISATGDFAPVRFETGAIGNDRPLEVSPQHRMLIEGWQAEMLFAEHQVLAAAIHLLNDDTIRRAHRATVTYHHIMFDDHQIVGSHGIYSESFHPTAPSIRGVSEGSRQELEALFPELFDLEIVGRLTARRTLKSFEAALIRP